MKSSMNRFKTELVSIAALLACSSCMARKNAESSGVASTGPRQDVNYTVGGLVVYEAQVRSANACKPDVGSVSQRAACQSKLAPNIPYRAEGMSCGSIDQLKAIKLGTINDMLEDTADYRQGITVRYIRDKVGANALWLMPVFPNNDRWSIPDECDDLGSPYAVRDYMHAAGTLSRACIQSGRDEYSTTPCWGNGDVDALIQQAHQRGMKVMFDVAFNHFGHNYLMYDYQDFKPVHERITAGEDLDKLWDFAATYEANLEHPKLMDQELALVGRAAEGGYHKAQLEALKGKCPNLAGDELVRFYNVWRNALPWERQRLSCSSGQLESQLPGFYLGRNAWDPAKDLGDNYTNNWRDVKFLFHHESNQAHRHEYVRNREYLFRVLNYWASRGVDGFRLDHATEGANGLSPNFWRYVTRKVNFYNQQRGLNRPFYMAEEFYDQMGMAQIADFMTEGYVFNITGRHGETKNTSFIEGAIANGDRFGGNTYVMTSLETHDEPRLTENTGFNPFTGAGFWGAGAATWSTPMLLMGQEFGEKWGIGFRRSDFLRARFEGSQNWFPGGGALLGFYHSMIAARQSGDNRALVASPRHFLRLKDNGGIDQRLFALMKWSEDGNVMFVLHNLWEQDVSAHYFIPQEVADAALIRNDLSYRLFEVTSNQQMGGCRTGADIKWDLPVIMRAGTRAQWLRLERCP